MIIYLKSAFSNFSCEFRMCWSRAILKRDNKMTIFRAIKHLIRTLKHITSKQFKEYSLTGVCPK